MYNVVWVELCHVLPICCPLQDHNWKYSLSYRGLKLCSQNWPLFESLRAVLLYFVVWIFGCVPLPAASFSPVLYIYIDLKGLQAKLKHELVLSLVTFQVTLCCWCLWELCPIPSVISFGMLNLFMCLFPTSIPRSSLFSLQEGRSPCVSMAHQLSGGCSLGVGNVAGALDRAARPWGTVLRTWTQSSLWVCLLVAANYNCKFALKIKFCLKSNFCLGAAL